MRNLRITFKKNAAPGRAEYSLLSEDGQVIGSFPEEPELDVLFQQVIAAEKARFGKRLGELKLLELLPNGAVIEIPSGYPGWIRNRLCEAISRRAK